MQIFCATSRANYAEQLGARMILCSCFLLCAFSAHAPSCKCARASSLSLSANNHLVPCLSCNHSVKLLLCRMITFANSLVQLCFAQVPRFDDASNNCICCGCLHIDTHTKARCHFHRAGAESGPFALDPEEYLSLAQESSRQRACASHASSLGRLAQVLLCQFWCTACSCKFSHLLFCNLLCAFSVQVRTRGTLRSAFGASEVRNPKESMLA